MEPVIFKVNKEGIVREINIGLDTTIQGLKEEIKNQYNITSYIDIDFQINKPMRILGKFNVEPGILPRTFDRYELNKFGINGDINLTFHEIDNYKPFKTNENRILNLKKYNIEGSGGKVSPGFNININSEEDFPKLG